MLLAFGAGSGIEMLSACVVFLAAVSPIHLRELRASRWAGDLLFLLAVVKQILRNYLIALYENCLGLVFGLDLN